MTRGSPAVPWRSWIFCGPRALRWVTSQARAKTSAVSSSTRIAWARRALRDLDEEAALRRNVLLAGFAGEGHDHLRARVLRALESLDPGLSAGPAADRRLRYYQILTRCDLQGEAHKEVTSELGLSRRQFYRDRSAAFCALAEAIEEQARHVPRVEVEIFDALSLQLDYVQALRELGRHEAVWRESMHALREMQGHSREVEVWTVAAESARFLGNLHQTREAMERMRRIVFASGHEHLRRASSLRIAISEMALDWMQGDPLAAVTRCNDAIKTSGSERTMYGRDATLFAILLGFAAEIHLECGEWRRAEELGRRAERIIDRSELPYARLRVHRLRGRLAMARDGDTGRSSVELRDALDMARRHRVLPSISSIGVEFGLALGALDPVEGSKYVDYALNIGREVCGYDEFAILVASSAPLIAKLRGPGAALADVDDTRARVPLSARADLYTMLARADLELLEGSVDVALERSMALSASFERSRLYPAAGKARVIAAECLARSGKTMQARRLLARTRDLLHSYGEQTTRRRAEYIGTHLALGPIGNPPVRL